MTRHRIAASHVKRLYYAKKMTPLPGGKSALHNASNPPMSNYQKVTFLGKLLFSVVLPGVDLMQPSYSVSSLILPRPIGLSVRRDF